MHLKREIWFDFVIVIGYADALGVSLFISVYLVRVISIILSTGKHSFLWISIVFS